MQMFDRPRGAVGRLGGIIMALTKRHPCHAPVGVAMFVKKPNAAAEASLAP
jgi:hypothetical protein